MIVLDASIVVELVTKSEAAESLRARLGLDNEHVIVPYLLDIEVMSALRKLAAAGRIDARDSDKYLEIFTRLPMERYPHDSLLGRIWELRHNFTAYDAVYIALSEMTGATLYTNDAKLRKGHRAQVVYFGTSLN